MTMKNRKTLQHIAAVAVVLLALCMVFAAPVAAEEASTAVDEATTYAEGHVAVLQQAGEEDTYYTTLKAAVDAAGIIPSTITLLCDVTDGTGVKIEEGRKIVIDFNNTRYVAGNPLAGSPGTVSQAFQLNKKSDVTLKNGYLSSNEARFLIQNYANLVVDNMTLDGSYLRDLDNGTLANWQPKTGEVVEVGGKKGMWMVLDDEIKALKDTNAEEYQKYAYNKKNTQEYYDEKFCAYGERVTLSNNNGTVTITNSKIIGKKADGPAKDYLHSAITVGWSLPTYALGTQVTIDEGSVVDGPIWFGYNDWNEKTPFDPGNNDHTNVLSTLTINAGEFKDSLHTDTTFIIGDGEETVDLLSGQIFVNGGKFADDSFNGYVPESRYIRELTAGYEVTDTCYVNFHVAGDSDVYQKTGTYKGVLASVERPTKDGHSLPETYYMDVALVEKYSASATINGDMDVYTDAWIEDTYTIVYDACVAGVADREADFSSTEETITLLTNNFVNEGKIFLGWNKTSNTGTGIDFINGEKVEVADLLPEVVDDKVTLYAVWTEAATGEVPIAATLGADGKTTATFNSAEVVTEIPAEWKQPNTTFITYQDAILAIMFENEADNSSFAVQITPDLVLDAPILGAVAVIPGSSAVAGELGVLEYYAVLGMTNLTDIPSLDGTFNDSVADSLPEDLDEVIMMVSGDEYDEGNITEVRIVFQIPKVDGLKTAGFVGYHVSSDSGSPTPLTGENFKIDDTKENFWYITLTGTGFSSYVIGYDEPAAPQQQENQAVILTPSKNKDVVDEPTVPPAEEPTDEPTDVPGEQVPDVPSTPVTPEEPSTPAPLFAVLAGLGAAVVLRRK